jgi:hypothetical protein
MVVGQAQKTAEVILLDPVLATGADALDPEIPDPNGGIQDITVVADGAPSKADLTAVPGFMSCRTGKPVRAKTRSISSATGVTESNVVTFRPIAADDHLYLGT